MLESFHFLAFSALLSAQESWPIWTISKDFLDGWFLGGFSKGGNTGRRSKEERSRIGHLPSSLPAGLSQAGYLPWPRSQFLSRQPSVHDSLSTVWWLLSLLYFSGLGDVVALLFLSWQFSCTLYQTLFKMFSSECAICSQLGHWSVNSASYTVTLHARKWHKQHCTFSDVLCVMWWWWHFYFLKYYILWRLSHKWTMCSSMEWNNNLKY